MVFLGLNIDINKMTVWPYFSSFHTSFLRFGYNCSGVSDEIIEMWNVLKIIDTE
jgi:hypothetical protein